MEAMFATAAYETCLLSMFDLRWVFSVLLCNAGICTENIQDGLVTILLCLKAHRHSLRTPTAAGFALSRKVIALTPSGKCRKKYFTNCN